MTDGTTLEGESTAQIFISYAREDRELAAALAAILEDAGWSVWWDRELHIGRPFDEVIQERLDQAECVIVLWSDTNGRRLSPTQPLPICPLKTSASRRY